MTSKVRRGAVAIALATGLLVGGVGVTQAFAQTSSPSASSSQSSGSGSSSNNGNSSSDNCPHDATNGSSSASSANA
jgi:hypothetical protein